MTFSNAPDGIIKTNRSETLSSEKTLWGVHMGKHHGTDPLDKGYIAIGWPKMGDLSSLPDDREAYKTLLSEVYPDKKPGAIPVDAGTLYRFKCEMQVGDLIIYPSKVDRQVNIGEVTGEYEYHAESAERGEDMENSHRRPVRWLKSFPRTVFSQSALYEIGSFISLFQVSKHAEEFLAVLRGEDRQTEQDDTAEVEAASEQVEESAADFVIRRLKTGMSPERFEHFVAHLLRCMGYHARVTQYGNDGGIDVIAHRDELGFEPPVIKVQCKQIVDNIGRPAVQQLMGAVEQLEYGLFVTLGGYTREAVDIERTKPNLRLIDGTTLTELIFEHYDSFEPQWQTLLPLKRRYIPGPVKSES